MVDRALKIWAWDAPPPPLGYIQFFARHETEIDRVGSKDMVAMVMKIWAWDGPSPLGYIFFVRHETEIDRVDMVGRVGKIEAPGPSGTSGTQGFKSGPPIQVTGKKFHGH